MVHTQIPLMQHGASLLGFSLFYKFHLLCNMHGVAKSTKQGQVHGGRFETSHIILTAHAYTTVNRDKVFVRSYVRV